MWRVVLDTTLCDVASCTGYNFIWCGELYWIQLYVMWRVVLDTTLCDVASCTGYNFIWCGELYWIQLYVTWRWVLDAFVGDVDSHWLATGWWISIYMLYFEIKICKMRNITYTIVLSVTVVFILLIVKKIFSL
jgi:hypothetical protein